MHKVDILEVKCMDNTRSGSEWCHSKNEICRSVSTILESLFHYRVSPLLSKILQRLQQQKEEPHLVGCHFCHHKIKLEILFVKNDIMP